MIALKCFRKIDLLIIVIIALAWVAANYLLADSFYTLLTVTSILMTFLMLLIRKTSCVLAFFALGGAIMVLLRRLGLLNMLSTEFIMSFMFVGILFEILTSLTRWRYANIVLSSAFSAATIPWTTMMLVGLTTRKIELEMLNFTLACFFIAAIGSIIALAIWRLTKATKFIIKLRYGFS